MCASCLARNDFKLLSDGDFQFFEDIAHIIPDDLVAQVDDASYLPVGLSVYD